MSGDFLERFLNPIAADDASSARTDQVLGLLASRALELLLSEDDHRAFVKPAHGASPAAMRDLAEKAVAYRWEAQQSGAPSSSREEAAIGLLAAIEACLTRPSPGSYVAMGMAAAVVQVERSGLSSAAEASFRKAMADRLRTANTRQTRISWWGPCIRLIEEQRALHPSATMGEIAAKVHPLLPVSKDPKGRRPMHVDSITKQMRRWAQDGLIAPFPRARALPANVTSAGKCDTPPESYG